MNRKAIKYKTVAALHNIEDSVNLYLNLGYELYGSPIVFSNKKDNYIVQAMVLYEEKN
jgi:hypothetical protein